MKKMLSILMLVALVSAVPAFAVEAGKNLVQQGEQVIRDAAQNAAGNANNTVKEAGFLTKAQDTFLVVAKNPYVQVFTIGSAFAGISAFAINYYNKNYVEKKKKRMNPGIIAVAAGLLTAGAAGTYIFWDNIHAYVFAGQKATETATVNGDAASKKLKEDADAAQKALNAKVTPKVEAPNAPEADDKKAATVEDPKVEAKQPEVVPNAEQNPEEVKQPEAPVVNPEVQKAPETEEAPKA